MFYSKFVNTLAGALCLVISSNAVLAQSPKQNGAALAQALTEVGKGNFDTAARLASQNQDPIAVEIIEWHRLRAGNGSFADYERFLAQNHDWPGLKLLRTRGEAAITANTNSDRVIAYFSSSSPQSGNGALRYALALRATGRQDAANAVAIETWRTFSLSSEVQASFWKTFSEVLRPYNVDRLDMLLWRERLTEAQRMYELVPANERQLADVRIALQRGKSGVNALINALPANMQNSAGLAFDRFRWRLDKDLWDGASEMLVERSTSAEALGRPEYWSNKRRSYARRAMRTGDHRTAYLLASQHFLTSDDSDYKDLEWLSGFLALRKLNDPQRALVHFQRFRATVTSPISIGRAGYWLGRTYEAMGDNANARSSYAMAASYQTSFYGQLAAERAGLPSDQSIAGTTNLPDWKSQAFLRTDSVRAAMLFHFAGQSDLARQFLSHASESLPAQERAAIVNLALDLGNPHAALRISKTAAYTGMIVQNGYYPITELTKISTSAPIEFVMSIARQESEFNPYARSSVGALGLMQVMPNTGKLVARNLGISFSESQLANDWKYNSKIGSTYLSDMLTRYNGSYVLAAAAYNAGPNRADRWIRDYGDPRASNVDVIDWIETIPFRETRNYVMRTTEALFVYRSRLSGRAPELQLMRDLKAGGR